MRRDKKLIDKILRYAEENADDGLTPCFPEFPCYTQKQVEYHIRLCVQAGLLETAMPGRMKAPAAIHSQGNRI